MILIFGLLQLALHSATGGFCDWLDGSATGSALCNWLDGSVTGSMIVKTEQRFHGTATYNDWPDSKNSLEQRFRSSAPCSDWLDELTLRLMATGLKALRLMACGVMIVMLRRMKVAEMAKYGRWAKRWMQLIALAKALGISACIGEV
ncbi:hypothetical protein M378DRAFT_180520 [Amanita muscaria Koide BX008]|uniref:Uncharacterized protein n=1 Tax=Amanita muscaria (strain Koide BX008) TaxID=946122 RepID=A0A0C2WTY4_AMAMK|nr:hypothetical protein M378DRAFT_180520 [Amanita muscaria Koide BX008]